MSKLSELKQEDLYDLVKEVGGEELMDEVREEIKELGTRSTMANQDFSEVHGELNGFPVSVRLYMDLDEEFTLKEYGELVIEVTKKMGLKPPTVRVQGGGGSGQGGGDDDGPSSGCPVHGTSNKSDTKFRGSWTCKAYADSPQSWSKDEPWTGRDGKQGPRYYCNSTWK